jgi:acetyl esterase/lipase
MVEPGSKVIESLGVYQTDSCTGHYFAAEHRIDTIIPDYRLVKHNGKHPSSVEDLALVLAYTRERHTEERPLFIMGNSTGGVNAMS